MKKGIEIKGKHAMFINCKVVKLDLFWNNGYKKLKKKLGYNYQIS